MKPLAGFSKNLMKAGAIKFPTITQCDLMNRLQFEFHRSKPRNLLFFSHSLLCSYSLCFVVAHNFLTKEEKHIIVYQKLNSDLRWKDFKFIVVIKTMFQRSFLYTKCIDRKQTRKRDWPKGYELHYSGFANSMYLWNKNSCIISNLLEIRDVNYRS